MRNISFMLTMEQVRQSFLNSVVGAPLLKDVTRRHGWWNAKPGEQLQAAEKCQGLGPGGKMVKMGVIRIKDAREEPLRRMIDEPEYGRDECRREGFPEMTPEEFVTFWCKGHKGTTPDSTVMRLEFEYVEAAK